MYFGLEYNFSLVVHRFALILIDCIGDHYAKLSPRLALTHAALTHAKKIATKISKVTCHPQRAYLCIEIFLKVAIP